MISKKSVLLILLVILAICVLGQDSLATEDDHHESRGLKIANYLREKGISPELAVIIISMLPIVELRGAIPVAHVFGMNPFLAYFLSVVGNMIPVIPILLLLGPISRFLMKFKWGKKFFDWVFERTRKRIGEKVEKYETLGLSVFVAIPLPITGAWTGCAGAFLFGIKTRHAFWAILLGVIVAGVIMTILSFLGWIGALIAGIVLLALLVNTVLALFKKEKKIEKSL